MTHPEPETRPSAESPVVQSREQFWQERIAHWQQSQLTQIAYCRQEGLSIHQLKYWRKKLEPRGETSARRSAFVPLQLAPGVRDDALRLTLPNGIVVSGISEQNLAVVSRLVAQL